MLIVVFPIRPSGDASDGKVSYRLCEAVAGIKGAFAVSLPLRAFGRERPASWGMLEIYEHRIRPARMRLRVGPRKWRAPFKQVHAIRKPSDPQVSADEAPNARALS